MRSNANNILTSGRKIVKPSLSGTQSVVKSVAHGSGQINPNWEVLAKLLRWTNLTLLGLRSLEEVDGLAKILGRVLSNGLSD